MGYTSISVSMKLVNGSTETGTLTAKWYQKYYLPNGDVIPARPEGQTFLLTNGAGTIQLAATDTGVPANVPIVLSWTAADGTVTNLGAINVPTNAGTVALNTLLTQGTAGVAIRKGLNYQALWSPTFAYNVDDVVSSGGSAYVCVVSNTNNIPPNPTYWGLLTSQGAVGPAGPTGPTGATGPQGVVGPIGLTGATGAQGTQGIQGVQGIQGIQGLTGSSPTTTTTGSYTQAAGALAIAVTDSTAFVVGEDVILTNSTNHIHGTVTAKSAGSITFQRYSTIPAGDTADATVYASGSTIAACGAQGATGAQGPAGSGAVSSVGLSLPADYTVTNSPVTTSGTLTAVRASQAAGLVLASPSGAPGAPGYRALVVSDLPTVDIAHGGTGATSKTAGFNALSPNTTLGDVAYFDGTNNVRLPGNTTTTRKFMLQVGNGSNSAAPSWSALASGDVTAALTFTPENAANRGAAGGYAGLDAGSKILASAVPIATASAVGGVKQGANITIAGDGTIAASSPAGGVTAAAGGSKIQSGSFAVSSQPQSFSFPVAFTTVTAVFATHIYNSANYLAVDVQSVSTTGFSVNTFNGTNSRTSGDSVYWLAIGT